VPARWSPRCGNRGGVAGAVLSGSTPSGRAPFPWSSILNTYWSHPKRTREPVDERDPKRRRHSAASVFSPYGVFTCPLEIARNSTRAPTARQAALAIDLLTSVSSGGALCRTDSQRSSPPIRDDLITNINTELFSLLTHNKHYTIISRVLILKNEECRKTAQ